MNSMRKIPFIDLQAQFQASKDELINEVTAVLASGKYVLGDNVRSFEQEFSSYVGSEKAVGCASGSDALLLALMAYDIKEGDEIITTPFTFFSTASCITRLGARPVFVDIDPATYNIDPAKIEEKITDKTKGIIVVHLFGQPADMDPIGEISKKYNLVVIEDADQAVGARYKGKTVGSLGDIGAFSFFPTKNLGCCGDGGIMTVQDKEIAERLIVLRDHGAKPQYYHPHIGVNSRLDEIQAAILKVKLKLLPDWTDKRCAHAARYNSLLGDTPVAIPFAIDNVSPVYNQYVIRVKSNRDLVREKLTSLGVSTGVYYPLPLSLQECFKYLGYKEGDLPHSENAAHEVLALPITPELSESDIEYVATKIKECVT